MSTEIPIWVNGEIRWLSGIDKKTTCKDVIEVLLEGEGIDKSEVKDFTIMERWRKVERPLDENSKILKIWSHWGYEKKEVRLCLRRIENEVDSGRGSPVGSGSLPSIRRKRNKIRGNGKTPLTYSEALHPRRLAELGQFDSKEYDDYYGGGKTKPTEISENYNCNLKNDNNYDEIYGNSENVNNCRKKSNKKSYHCPSTGKLHSTLLSEYTDPKGHTKKATKCCSKRESKHRLRNSENIEKLMKLILAQGATIQNQLQKLKEREEQIESIEQERHRERIEKNGRNYLLETYLGSLKDAEIPAEVDEEKAEDSGVNTEVGSDQLIGIKKQNLDRLQQQNETELESDDVNEKIIQNENLEQVRREEESKNQHVNHSTLRIHKKTARSKSESRSQELKSEITIKRTLSDNSLENFDGTNKKNEKIKDDSDEVVELRKIQSQIEIWEKVFKINKKLEKEEENLVRLHLKIKKYQNENYRFTKEKTDRENEDDVIVNNDKKSFDSAEEIDGEQDYQKIKKSLETLKSDLDQNSKEIYNNFTKLIEEDERVEQKRNCLTKLISDLERTNLEQDMLNEMITMREKRETNNGDQSNFYGTNSNEIKECDKEKNFHSFSKNVKVNSKPNFPDGNTSITQIPTCTDNNNYNTCSKIYNVPHHSELCSNNNQSNEKVDVVVIDKKMQQQQQQPQPQLKPKTVKISFEEKVQSCENLEIKENQEKLSKESGGPTVAVGALKGILKNRKQQSNKNSNDLKLDTQTSIQNNHEQSNNYYLNYSNTNQNFFNMSNNPCRPVDDVPDDQNNNYNYLNSIGLPIYDQSFNEPNQNYVTSTPLPNSYDLKTAYSINNSRSNEITRPPPLSNVYPHSTIVKTKGTILNDTDSSTSSDTSGLCSMYSSSPSVEQPYITQGYILDTLV